MAALDEYLSRRDFDRTPEPSDPTAPPTLALRYSMQKHDATRLHFDLRLEWQGVLLSWAVTRGPSLDPAEKRLAVRTEDHPLSYLTFEGVIPSGYGAGTVMLWDIGHWQPDHDPGFGLDKGHLAFRLHGRRATGGWDLVRINGRATDRGRENWLLIKKDDEAARGSGPGADPVRHHVRSAASNRDLPGIAADEPPSPFGPRRTAPAPRFRPPQLATAAAEVGCDPARWHELKFDGYRALVALGRDGPRIFTRNGHDWSDRFAPLLPALADLPARTALLDGEIVAGAGLQGFSTLQQAIRLGGPFTFYAFDLIERDGADLTDAPLTRRRAELEALVAGAPPLGLVQTSPVIRQDAAAHLATVCAAGGEGLISKRMDAPYRGGRSSLWEKIKCSRRGSFAVIGWQPSARRGRPFASLLLAERTGTGLAYRGKVGTGFDGDALETIAAALRPLAVADAPIPAPPAETRGARWVRPAWLADVQYAETTADGLLRHAVFEGFRPAPAATAAPSGDRPVIAGIAVSSGDRVVFPTPRTTKLAIARYYAEVADRLLADAADRPLSLLRLPEGLSGERFFQKHAMPGWPGAIRRMTIATAAGGRDDLMYVRDAAGLVAAAQMGTVELHIWGSRRDRPEHPDRMVFDLDPDEALGFAAVRAGAERLRAVLAEIGLDSWAMVTGGKGVHVVVPLRRTAGWPVVRGFSQTLAVALAEREPRRFTASMSKARRTGRIFIDWLRNERGATAIAPFSLRARPGARVAVPVAWDELRRLRRADAFDMRRALARSGDAVDRPTAQTLSAATVAALEAWIAG